MNRGIFVVLCALSLALCRPAFTKVDLVKKNPDLGKLALERAAAGKRYNDALKRAFERDETNK